ncbi:MAG: hypothetical protein Tsb009_06040 [Planctomycetaceae bacterium]
MKHLVASICAVLVFVIAVIVLLFVFFAIVIAVNHFFLTGDELAGNTLTIVSAILISTAGGLSAWCAFHTYRVVLRSSEVREKPTVLFNCPNCGEAVSDNLQNCPMCGCEQNRVK